MGQGYIDRPMTSKQRAALAEGTQSRGDVAPMQGFTSIDALIAPGGPLEGYANLVQSARYGAVGSPLIPATGAAIKSGAEAARDVVSRATAAAMPAIKDEVTTRGLEAFGVPSVIARPIGAVVSGRRGARPTASARPAAPSSPAASAPATPAPAGAPNTPGSAPRSTPAPQWSPQRLRNEVGLAARRQKTRLTEQEYAVAEGMVKQGVSPADAVKTVAQQIAQPAPPATKMRLNVAEVNAYTQLRRLGKSHQEAADAIQQQRTLARSLGTPSSRTVQQKVAKRNATGRWDE